MPGLLAGAPPRPQLAGRSPKPQHNLPYLVKGVAMANLINENEVF